MDQGGGLSLFQSSKSPHRLQVISATIPEGGKQGANQKNICDWFRSTGLQLPKEGTPHGNEKLRTEADVVNRSIDPKSVTIKTDENGEPGACRSVPAHVKISSSSPRFDILPKIKPCLKQKSAQGGPAVSSIVKPE
jgi:hypothetical protein